MSQLILRVSKDFSKLDDEAWYQRSLIHVDTKPKSWQKRNEIGTYQVDKLNNAFTSLRCTTSQKDGPAADTTQQNVAPNPGLLAAGASLVGDLRPNFSCQSDSVLAEIVRGFRPRP